MSKIIEAEVAVVDQLLPKELIRVVAVPEIEFTKLKQFNVQVMNEISRLDLDNMVATPDNVKEIKGLRTDVRKSLKELEDSRKLTERTIMKPYKEFERQYNELIKLPLTVADKQLKSKVDTVEDAMRAERVEEYKELVEGIKEANEMEFVNYEDLGLNIQLSTPDNQLRNEVDAFFTKVKNDLRVIDTHAYKSRVLAMYMKDLDLTNAIINVENALEVERALEAKAKEVQPEPEPEPEVKPEPIKVEPEAKERIITAQFTVKGTKQQLNELADYMKERGITYE